MNRHVVDDVPHADSTRNVNRERTVECPICGEEKLARGIYLHVNRSVGNGHGEQGEVPEGVDLDNLETAGERNVSMNYPESRKTEQVGRQCPYCEGVFRGKHGVMIHLGRIAGKESHPENAKEEIDPEDLPIVQVDEQGDVVEVVEEGGLLPSSRHRREGEKAASFEERVRALIKEFRQEGNDEVASRIEETLPPE